MASQRQAEANRRNAQASTGPRTREGKNIVSRNAVQHGLLCAKLFRTESEEEEFRSLAEQFHIHFAPVGPLEILLVDRIVSTIWRLRRLLETEGLIQEDQIGAFQRQRYSVFHELDVLESKQDVPYALEAILDQGVKLTRYETALERSLYRSLHELQRLQAARAGVQVPLPLVLDIDIQDSQPDPAKPESCD